MRVEKWVDRAWIPSLGSWQTSESSSSQKCQKCFLDFTIVLMVSSNLGCLLTLQGDGPIAYEGLESLSIFALKHYAELLPASVAVVSLLGVDVEGFQEVKSPGIDHFPVLRLMGELKWKEGASQQLCR